MTNKIIQTIHFLSFCFDIEIMKKNNKHNGSGCDLSSVPSCDSERFRSECYRPIDIKSNPCPLTQLESQVSFVNEVRTEDRANINTQVSPSRFTSNKRKSQSSTGQDLRPSRKNQKSVSHDDFLPTRKKTETDHELVISYKKHRKNSHDELLPSNKKAKADIMVDAGLQNSMVDVNGVIAFPRMLYIEQHRQALITKYYGITDGPIRPPRVMEIAATIFPSAPVDTLKVTTTHWSDGSDLSDVSDSSCSSSLSHPSQGQKSNLNDDVPLGSVNLHDIAEHGDLSSLGSGSISISSDLSISEPDPDDESTGSTDLFDIQEPPHLYFGFGCPEVMRILPKSQHGEAVTSTEIILEQGDLVVFFDNCIHLDDFNSDAENKNIFGITHGPFMEPTRIPDEASIDSDIS